MFVRHDLLARASQKLNVVTGYGSSRRTPQVSLRCSTVPCIPETCAHSQNETFVTGKHAAQIAIGRHSMQHTLCNNAQRLADTQIYTTGISAFVLLRYKSGQIQVNGNHSNQHSRVIW